MTKTNNTPINQATLRLHERVQQVGANREAAEKALATAEAIVFLANEIRSNTKIRADELTYKRNPMGLAERAVNLDALNHNLSRILKDLQNTQV